MFTTNRSGRAGAAAFMVGALVASGCSSPDTDVAAVVQGEVIPRSFIDDFAQLESINGQEQQPITTDSGYDANAARGFLAQTIAMTLARQELLAIGFEVPAALRQQVEQEFGSAVFVPDASDEFRDRVVEFVMVNNWLQNVGEVPEGAAEKLLQRHPELGNQVCYDAVIATDETKTATKAELAKTDITRVTDARVDSCLPITDIAMQPAEIRAVLSSGRVGEVVGPVTFNDDPNGARYIWIRPRGSEPLAKADAIANAEGLLAQPAVLGPVLASLAGLVDVSSEFGDLVSGGGGVLSISPAGVDAPLLPQTDPAAAAQA